MKDNYVLITPLKNEEITIKQVIDSVKRQSIRPSLWIIVNDGSTDNSQKILDTETKNEDWIYVINKEINSSYNWLAISSVLNEGMKKLETLLDDEDLSVRKKVLEQIAKFSPKKAKKILYELDQMTRMMYSESLWEKEEGLIYGMYGYALDAVEKILKEEEPK